MRGDVIVAAGMLAAGLLLAVWLYTERTAYRVVAGDKFAYLIDQRTGEAWWLVANQKKPVSYQPTVQEFLLSPQGER